MRNYNIIWLVVGILLIICAIIFIAKNVNLG